MKSGALYFKIIKIIQNYTMKASKPKYGFNDALNAFVETFTAKYPTKEDLMTIQYELGIDQAGRGPVLGSMVYSALWWPREFKQKFGELGFQDSKKLKEQDREQLFDLIQSLSGKIFFFEVQELTATHLSQKMQQFEGVNLNTLSHNAAVKLIRSALAQGFKIVDIYVDTVGDPEKYKNYIWNRIEDFKGVVEKIVVQPKADQDHKVVSASSICAKVTRDRIIGNWKFPQNLQFEGPLGSGYPSDPTTKQWLANNKHKVFGFPNLIRFSWNTTTNLLENYGVLKMNQEADEQKHKGLNGVLKAKNIDLFNIVPY